MNTKVTKSKIEVIWSMRKWPKEYIKWRLVTAYPNGWKFALSHPIIFIKDLWKFLTWCQMIDNDIEI